MNNHGKKKRVVQRNRTHRPCNTGLSAYCSSKAGLTHLTRVLALEWAKHGIRVNAVCPGYFRTEMNSDFFDTPSVRPVSLTNLSQTFSRGNARSDPLFALSTIPLPVHCRVQPTNARCPTLSPLVHVHHTAVQGDRVLKTIPMRRLGDPAELDGLLLMLASERASSYMTGSVLTLDGGIMLSNL